MDKKDNRFYREIETNAAIDALTNNQRQLDANGCEVGVSRQALDETLTAVQSAIDTLVYARANRSRKPKRKSPTTRRS